MCVAYPGRVLSIEERKAKVDFNGNIVDVNIGLVDAKVNDYVLVHAGMAIESMTKEKADEILEIFKDLDAL
jgi:hydrogenase expression/formation protein HypC